MPKKTWWTSTTRLILLSLFCAHTISVALATGGNATGDVMDFSSGSNLTDQEKITSETYIHQGLTQEKIDEGCKTDASKDTAGNKDDNQAMRDACSNRERHWLSNMVPMVIKAAAVVIGAGLGGEYEVNKTTAAGQSTEQGAGTTSGGSTPSTSSGATGQQGGQQQQQQKEKKQDYCRYIAMATEALAMFQQMAAQQNLSSTAGSTVDPNAAQMNQQKENLYRAKRSHEERATTAQIQAWGWTATGSCYAITIATAALGPGLAGAGDWANLLLKLGLSGFAATYYFLDAKYQEDAAKKIGAVIDQLPGAGDCNPITERHCFCSQPSSVQDTGNFMKYCAPQIRGQQLAANGLKVSCVDGKGQADPECNCRNSNSCFDVEFMNMIGGLKFGKTPEEVLGRDVRDLSRGNVSSGDLRSGQLGNAAASRLKSLIRNLDLSKAPKAPPLGPNQTGLADLMAERGLPRSLTSLALNSKAPPNMAQFAGKMKNYEVDSSVFNSLRDGNAKILTFSGGMGPGKKSAGNSNQFDLNKLLKKKDGPAASGEQVLKFAERASESAQINKNPDTGIFDIISYRYRASGWKRVNVE